MVRFNRLWYKEHSQQATQMSDKARSFIFIMLALSLYSCLPEYCRNLSSDRHKRFASPAKPVKYLKLSNKLEKKYGYKFDFYVKLLNQRRRGAGIYQAILMSSHPKIDDFILFNKQTVEILNNTKICNDSFIYTLDSLGFENGKSIHNEMKRIIDLNKKLYRF